MRRLFATLTLALVFAFAVAGNVQAQDVEDIMELKLKIVELQNKGELGIGGFTFCRKIMSYASYVPLPDNTIEQGGTLRVYFEPTFWFTNVAQGRYEMWMTQDVALDDSEGKRLFEREKLLDMHYNTAKPVLDVYMTNEFNLGKLPAGEYMFVVTLHDELSGKQAEHKASFTIK